MYGIAKSIQSQLRRDSAQYRLAHSVERCITLSLGRRTVTFCTGPTS